MRHFIRRNYFPKDGRGGRSLTPLEPPKSLFILTSSGFVPPPPKKNGFPVVNAPSPKSSERVSLSCFCFLWFSLIVFTHGFVHRLAHYTFTLNAFLLTGNPFFWGGGDILLGISIGWGLGALKTRKKMFLFSGWEVRIRAQNTKKKGSVHLYVDQMKL